MAETKASLQKKYNSFWAKKAAAVKKRDRLQDAYDALKNVKDDHSDFKNRLYKKADEKSDDWEGSNYEEYLSQCMFAKQTTKKINDRIDVILDDINTAKKEANNEITYFGREIRAIKTKIENWTN